MTSSLQLLDTAVQARAFNAGCDARLNGRPRTANPYMLAVEGSGGEANAWDRGWGDVADNWGKQARHWFRGSVMPLPPVKWE